MKRNVKVIDEHNIDRNANIVFALELEGSEYVVYWIERDEESNNLFVSKVLKNIDGTYNMMNIDDSDKKKDISEIIKTLIFNSVSDQNDKMVGTTTTLADGKSVRFVNVMFNKEQNINVPKTYITTVKKEVTKVAETYYDVVIEEAKVEEILPSVTPVVETPVVPQPQPVVAEPVAPAVVETPVLIQPEVVAAPVLPETPVAVVSQPVVAPTPVEVVPPVTTAPVAQPMPVEVPTLAVPQPQPVVAEPVTPAVVETPVLIQPEVVAAPVLPETPVAVVSQPVVAPTPVEVVPPVTTAPVVQPMPVEVPTPVVSQPQPVVVEPVAPAVVQPTPVAVPTESVQTPVAQSAPVETAPQGLVFNAAKEKNLNAALGEVANSTTIPVENIAPVREFGVEEAVPQTAQVVVAQPTQEATPITPADATPASNSSGGFANSKFFMVVAIAFFLASCIFLGYEVYNYFQLVK